MNSRDVLDQLTTPQDDQEANLITSLIIQVDEINKLWVEHPDAEYEKKDKAFVEKLQKVPEQTIFKLAEKSKAFRLYCESDRHSNLWQQFLQKKGYHGEHLPSVDTTEKCSTLQQYVGRYLLGLWKKNPQQALLDKACEMNIFPALTTRCHQNLALLKKNINVFSAEKIADLESKITNDLNHICNQYWAPGYLYSYSVYMALSQLHHTQNTDLHSEEYAPQAYKEDGFLKLALECEMIAEELINHSTSQKILSEHGIEKQITRQISDFPAAKKLVLDSIRPDMRNTIADQALKEVQEKVKHFKI